MGRKIIVGTLGGAAAAVYIWDILRHNTNTRREGKHNKCSLPLDPRAYKLIGEGGMHSVFAISDDPTLGGDQSWRRKVLRLRRKDAQALVPEVKVASDVIPLLFGHDVVPSYSVTHPHKDLMDALASQTKNGVAEECIAIVTENLLTAPVEGKCVSFELKPKCGLKEKETTPSRFQMLQRIKLRDGEIERISEYDPVDLFSGKEQRVLKAMKALLADPQNNLVTFIDGEHVNAEEAFNTVPMHELTGVILSSDILRKIASVQCWAGGKCANWTKDLMDSVEQHGGSIDLDTPALVASIIPSAGHEGAMRQHERDGKQLVEWNARHYRSDSLLASDVGQQAHNYIRRFLLGRTAMDVSVMITFVKPEGKPDVDALKRARFFPHKGYWVCISVVDTELKPLDRVPRYATELDEYTKWYFNEARKAHQK